MYRVLIIEDEMSILMVLDEFLTDAGYKVEKAYNGESGLKMLDREDLPDIVIVDLKMPGISGKGVIETMRSQNRLRDIPVIIITGNIYNSSEFPERGSYQDILEKPFDLSEMLVKINTILGEGRHQGA